MKDQLEEANKKHSAGSSSNSASTIPANTPPAPSAAAAALAAKIPGSGPNLKDIERNNRLRTVEAHLYATIVNNPAPVRPTPPVVAPTSPVITKDPSKKALTPAQTTPSPASSASSAVGGDGFPRRGTDSAPHSRSGSFNYSAKSMKPHTQVVITHAPTPAAAGAPAGSAASTVAAAAAKLVDRSHKEPYNSSAVSRAIKQGAVSAAASTPVVATITNAVEAHMAGITVVADPSEYPLYQKNKQNMAAHRLAVTSEIRKRKLERQRAWDMLGDAYLEINHKWTAHIEALEKEEGGWGAGGIREGPKLRGSGNAIGSAFGSGAFSGFPGALSSSIASVAAAAIHGSVGGSTADLAGLSATTRSSEMGGSRSSGLGVARSDYEQVRTSITQNYRMLLFN